SRSGFVIACYTSPENPMSRETAPDAPVLVAEDRPLEPDPVIEAYKRDIDRTLLRENLKLTVDERFRKLQELQRFAAELRRAGRASLECDASPSPAYPPAPTGTPPRR